MPLFTSTSNFVTNNYGVVVADAFGEADALTDAEALGEADALTEAFGEAELLADGDALLEAATLGEGSILGSIDGIIVAKGDGLTVIVD